MPDAPSSDAPPVAVVGAGALGTALARRLVTCGYPVRAVLSRRPAAAQALAEQVGAPVASDDPAVLPADVRLVLLCVPDDALPDVAARLAAVDHPWDRTVVAHTSGLRAASVLRPLAAAGAAPLSFHPLQTFTSGTPPEAFEDIAIALEGHEAAVTAGEGLAQALGARPVTLGPTDKAAYHCAAALVSNGLVALLGAAEEMLATTALQDTDPAALFGPLVEQTWANLVEGRPEGALTGPVARGDRATVEAHLDALVDDAPHLVPLYAALSTEMVRLAVRGGSLSPEEARSLLGVLREATQNGPGGPD